MFNIVPKLLVGLTVDELPTLSDAAAGVDMSPVAIQNICHAVSALKEGFDESGKVMSRSETAIIVMMAVTIISTEMWTARTLTALPTAEVSRVAANGQTIR